MKTFVIRIRGRSPEPQPRPRVYRHGGVRTDSPAVRAWKNHLILALRAEPDTPSDIDVRCGIRCLFHLRRPSRHIGAKGLVTPAYADLGHFVKPDGDNLLKAVLDAQVDAGAMRDDALVGPTEYDKVYAEGGPDTQGIDLVLWWPAPVLPFWCDEGTSAHPGNPGAHPDRVRQCEAR